MASHNECLSLAHHAKEAHDRAQDVNDSLATASASGAPLAPGVGGFGAGVAMAAEAYAIALVLQTVIIVRDMLVNAKTNVNKCSHLARRLEQLEPILRTGAQAKTHYIADKKLKPLADMLDQVKVCVFEFNKVNKTQKLKRVMRSGEFKDKFASYNALLNDIIQDLTLVTVTDAAAHAKVVAEAARDAAAAERADLASLTEEVRLVNTSLQSTLQKAEPAGAMAKCEAKTQREAKEALEALQTQAAAQTAQMRALAAQGIADATALSAQLDNIQREAAAAAKAAATAREESEESATARAEDLAKRHAEALARLEFVASASNNAVSGEVQRSAKATLEAMQASQAKLMAAITSCRSQETEALQATIRSGSAEAKAAATQLLENVQGLTQLHTLEMAALRDVARDTAELKQLMANMAATLGRVDQTTSDTLIGVKELMAMMQAMQAKLSAPNETPAQRKDKLVKALQACTVRVKRAGAGLGSVYSACDANPELQMALQPVCRQVELVAAAMELFREKLGLLPSSEAGPDFPVEEMTAIMEALCSSVTAKSRPTAVVALQQRLRHALGALAEANEDVNRTLRGVGADAVGDVPAGWARELWSHAFGRTIWSGTLGQLKDAYDSYRGAHVDFARYSPFLELKQQDFKLGSPDRVDVVEWRAMARATADVDSQALAAPVCAVAEQMLVDRLISAYISSGDVGFSVSVKLKPKADQFLPRGMAVTPTGPRACGVALMSDPVFLEVTATEDCYIYLIEQDSSGGLCFLLPNAADPNANNRVRRNEVRTVPDKERCGDRFDISFTPPAGLERVVAFASRTPWADYANLMRMNEGRQRTAALARSVVLSRGMTATASSDQAPSQHNAAPPAGMALAELRFLLVQPAP